MLSHVGPQEGVTVGEEMSLSPLIDSDFLPWRNYTEGSELNFNPLNLIKPFLGKSDFNKNLKGREASRCKLENRGKWSQTGAPGLWGLLFLCTVSLGTTRGDCPEAYPQRAGCRSLFKQGRTLSPRNPTEPTVFRLCSHTLPVAEALLFAFGVQD